MVLILKNDKWHFDELLLLKIRLKYVHEVRSILTSDELCKATDSNKSTLLHFSSEYGNANITQYLIDSGVNVNSQDAFGRTPLLLAVTRIRELISAETVNVLLEAQADFLKADIQGKYPLQHLVDNKTFDKLSVVKRFFRRLAEYCLNDNKLMADLLIEANCPLERAIYLNNPSITEMMIQAGYPVDELHPRLGHTPLHVAASIMDLQNVKVLIKCGADVTARMNRRLLPLSMYFLAVKYQHRLPNPEIMKLLMSEYFRASDKAEDVVLSVKHTLQLGDEETIRHVLQYDIDFASVTGNHDNSILHYLAMNDNPNVAEAFESHITDVNARNGRGCTPLHFAVVTRNASTLRVFLKNGGNANAKSYLGNSPLSALFLTLSERHCLQDREILEILLQHDADIQVFIPDTRETLFDHVAKHGRFDLGELLVAKLAFLEKLGQPIIDLIRSKIDAHSILKNHYDLCKRQLEEMKGIVIYGTINLFKILSHSEKEIIRRYAYNEELLEELENFSTKYWFESYYYDILRDRIASALPKIKLIQEVTAVMFDLIGPRMKRNHLIVRSVIDHLSYEDMRVLNTLKIS